MVDHIHHHSLIAHRSFEIEAKDLCYQAPSGTFMGSLWAQKDSSQQRSSLTSSMILKNVSFVAKPGEVLAIAGPSGAGKSTLLEVVAGLRRASGSGSVLVNQHKMAIATFRRISGFVPQSDVLFPMLTVRETLMFSARLRLPASVSSVEKATKVTALIAELGLMHVADARVGGKDVSGVSGGERRKVSIGTNVLHDPLVLVLDEPTSGLDSASALLVMTMLKSMAKMRSCTIILSIHQPSCRIIEQINNFLLLVNGSVVHKGSLEMLNFSLRAQGHTIPPELNTLEYALEVLNANRLLANTNKTSIPMSSYTYNKGLHSCSTHVTEGNAEADNQPGCARGRCTTCVRQMLTWPLEDCVEAVSSTQQPTTSATFCISIASGLACMQRDTEKPGFANSNMKEVMMLSVRFLKNLLRVRKLVMSRMLQALGAGLLLGSIYMKVGMDMEGVIKRFAFFAFTLSIIMTASARESVPIFLQEREVVMREASRGGYRVSSYVVATGLVFLPLLLVIALLYAIPAYYLMGLSTMPSAFCTFVMIVWLVLVMANSCVAFFSTLAPDFVKSMSLMTACFNSSLLFSGFFISGKSMPVYWRFMHYLSFFKYPLEALLINEYSSLQAQNKCFTPPSPLPPTCSLPPSLVLQQLGLHQTHMWKNVAIMVAFLSSYRLLYYFVLRIHVSKRSR